MSKSIEKVIIIGSGPAGLTAAIYAARANLQPVLFEGFNAGGLIPGGQLMFTTDVENYPGFPEGITGPKMMEAFRQQAARFETHLIREDVDEIDLSERPFTVKSASHEMKTHAVIIATGARANWLDLENEQRLARSGGGVSACAVCDGAMPMYRDQEVVVVGGGDSAVEEGSYLTKFAKKVYLIHRRDKLRASKIMQERIFKLQEEGKAEIIWNSVVTDVLGEDTISGVQLKNRETGEEWVKDCKGLFLAIGHTPNTDLFKPYLEMHDNGYIKWTVPGRAFTSREGVFASGDVADFTYRQAVTAAGTGCAAAIDCERWLAEQGID
jgi:thioredoxin reductase (NADPH)